MTGDVALPRPIAALIFGAIALATAAAIVWPALPFNAPPPIVPTKVGIIAKQIDEPGAAPRIGERAPDFEWVAPDGTRRSLSSLRPKRVVLNFWATWCVPCKEEMPLLERTAGERADIVFLAVDLDESGDQIRAFFDELGLTRIEPLLDVGLATSRRYGLASVPSTFFIDTNGVIRHIQIGEMDEEKLGRGLQRIGAP